MPILEVPKWVSVAESQHLSGWEWLFDRKNLPDRPGIYFVCSDDKSENPIKYIGQTQSLKKRWSYHHRMNDFKNLTKPYIYYSEYPLGRLDFLEKKYIEYIQPELNGLPL